jgi:hypothetical protein
MRLAVLYILLKGMAKVYKYYIIEILTIYYIWPNYIIIKIARPSLG